MEATSVKWKPAEGKMVYDVCRHLYRILELLDEIKSNPKQDNTLMLKIVYSWIEEAQERLMSEIIPKHIRPTFYGSEGAK